MDGTHVRTEGGLDQACARLQELGATAGQIYLTNPKSFYRKTPLTEAERDAVDRFVHHPGRAILAHAPYFCVLTNDPIEGKQKQANKSLVEQLHLAEELGLHGVVVHLGGWKDEDHERRLANAVRNITDIMKTARIGNTRLLLENGVHGRHASLQQLKDLIDYVGSQHVGICLDTAHAYAAGIDTREVFDRSTAIDPFRDLIHAVHFNNSRYQFHSRRDGHGALADGSQHLIQLRELYQHLRFELDIFTPFVIEATADPREVELLRVWNSGESGRAIMEDIRLNPFAADAGPGTPLDTEAAVSLDVLSP